MLCAREETFGPVGIDGYVEIKYLCLGDIQR